MLSFIIQTVIWTLILYIGFEIMRIIIYYLISPKVKQENEYMIITVRDGEEYIEGYLRLLIFNVLYGKENYIKQILIMDLGSKDNTRNIIKKLELQYKCIKLIDFEEFKDIEEAKV